MVLISTDKAVRSTNAMGASKRICEMIFDVSKKMIRLSGHVPGNDIKIEFTGLRQDEKLYEELLIDEKSLIEKAYDES